MGKRGATSAQASAAKRAAVNPTFLKIQDAVKAAEHLPATCRDMLAALVPVSLAASREDRGEEQSAAVQWIEETLQQQCDVLAGEVDAANAAMQQLEAAKAEHLAAVQKAEETLAELAEAVPSKQDAVAEANIALTASKKAHQEKQEEHQGADGPFLAKKKELEGLQTAIEESFKVPVAAGEAVHFSALQPYVGALELEESLKLSIPQSCCKTKEQRGSFDELVLQSLEKALLERAEQLRQSVASENAGFEERQAAVRIAEEQAAANQAAQQKAFEELSNAQKNVEVASGALQEAKKVVAGGDAEIKAALRVCEQHRGRKEAFEQGPLAAFTTARDKAAVSANAGA